MRNKRFFSVSFILFLLVGCSSVNGNETNDIEMPAIVDVKIRTSSENPAIGEKVKIEAVVTQAGIIVDDANEVTFEIWEVNNDDHEMIVGEYGGKGTYFTSKAFESNGKYNIVAHVTARDQHTMPKIELLVGTHSEEVKAEPSYINDLHADGGFSIDLNFPLELNEDHSLSIEAIVIHDGHPLKEAKVKFETWTESITRHDFFDATETEAGVYTAIVKLEVNKKYNIIVHIQKDKIHEHIERVLEFDQ